MESLLKEEFGAVSSPSSSSSEVVLQRWRDVCGVVKNPNRSFRFTANLYNRHQTDAMCRTHQEKLNVAILVHKSASLFVQGMRPSDYTVSEEPSDYTRPEEVEAPGVQFFANELEPRKSKFLEEVKNSFLDVKACFCACFEDLGIP